MRRVFALAALVLAIGSIVAFTGAAAYAGGNGAQTFTQTFKNQTDPPFVDFVPCRDFQASITLTYNGVLHYIVNKAGDFWATGTMTGTVTAVPLDASNPSFTGRFTTWFGESFFFQAEVGIRDLTVTGVQTCALPIWWPGRAPPRRSAPPGRGRRRRARTGGGWRRWPARGSLPSPPR